MADQPVGQRVPLCIEKTRYVGGVDGEGFLRHAQQHIDEGTLAPAMVFSIRARISSVELGGTLGDGRLDVEVVIHRDLE